MNCTASTMWNLDAMLQIAWMMLMVRRARQAPAPKEAIRALVLAHMCDHA
jgi:hypothetical protein